MLHVTFWRLKMKGPGSCVTISTKTVSAFSSVLPGYGASIPRVRSYLRAEVQTRNWGALILILPTTVWDRSANPFSGSAPQCRSPVWGPNSNPLHLVIWVILWPPSLGINLILLLGGKQGTLASLPIYGQVRFCMSCVCTQKDNWDSQLRSSDSLPSLIRKIGWEFFVSFQTNKRGFFSKNIPPREGTGPWSELQRPLCEVSSWGTARKSHTSAPGTDRCDEKIGFFSCWFPLWRDTQKVNQFWGSGCQGWTTMIKFA